MADKSLPKWDDVRPLIKAEFERAGITSCEVTFPRCLRGSFPTYAHSKKRVDWYSLADVEAVIHACTSCHEFIEHLGKKNIISMEEIVERIRANRTVPVRSVFGYDRTPASNSETASDTPHSPRFR